MKLDKDNLEISDSDSSRTYRYTCPSQDGKDTYVRLIYVKKNAPTRGRFEVALIIDGTTQELLTTDQLTDAWAKFEDYIDKCQGIEQSSSGGFAKNPQQDPMVMPFLAISNAVGGSRQVSFFLAFPSGEQVTVVNFSVPDSPELSKKGVQVVDWTKVANIPFLFGCKMIVKQTDIVVWEDGDGSETVFLFIPQNIASQGGDTGNDEGGDTTYKKKSNSKEQEQPEGEPGGGGEGEGEPGGGGEGEGEPGEGGEGEGEPGEGGEGEGEPGEGGEGEGEPGEGGEGEGKPGEGKDDDSGGGKDRKGGREDEASQRKVSHPDLIVKIAQITGSTPPSIISNFRNETSGALFLSRGNNRENVAKAFGLTTSITAQELSKIITPQINK